MNILLEQNDSLWCSMINELKGHKIVNTVHQKEYNQRDLEI